MQRNAAAAARNSALGGEADDAKPMEEEEAKAAMNSVNFFLLAINSLPNVEMATKTVVNTVDDAIKAGLEDNNEFLQAVNLYREGSKTGEAVAITDIIQQRSGDEQAKREAALGHWKTLQSHLKDAQEEGYDPEGVQVLEEKHHEQVDRVVNAGRAKGAFGGDADTVKAVMGEVADNGCKLGDCDGDLVLQRAEAEIKQNGCVDNKMGGGDVVVDLTNSEAFFGSNIYGTLIANAFCLEWLCTPMVGDEVSYSPPPPKDPPPNSSLSSPSPPQKKETKGTYIVEEWKGNNYVGPSDIPYGGQWFNNLLKGDTFDLNDNQGHISQIRWSGKMVESKDGVVVPRNDRKRRPVSCLYPSSLFMGEGRLKSINRWETDNKVAREEEMQASFNTFIENINLQSRITVYANSLGIGFNGGDADLKRILNEVSNRLAKIWYNETQFTFPSSDSKTSKQNKSNLNNIEQKVISQEMVNALTGPITNRGLMVTLIQRIRHRASVVGVAGLTASTSCPAAIFKKVKTNKDQHDKERKACLEMGEPAGGRKKKVALCRTNSNEVCIYDGKSQCKPIIKTILDPKLEGAQAPSAVEDASLDEYLTKSIMLGNEAGVQDGEMLDKINTIGIYMIINLPSHGHTVLVLFKNNKIYTAGGGLWGENDPGNNQLLCMSPDDTILKDEVPAIAEGKFGKNTLGKKRFEEHVITKIGFINNELITRLSDFLNTCTYKEGLNCAESQTYRYSLTNTIFDNTLSCITWAWKMVTGKGQIINIKTPWDRSGVFVGVRPECTEDTLSRGHAGGDEGGGRRTKRRKRRRKRKHTKRTKHNKKKRTKKHRKKRKYTKYRR